MLLITLDKHPRECHVELNGQDISAHVRAIEIDATIGDDAGLTEVHLTLIDDVAIIGEAGLLHFHKAEPRHD